jgi:putative transposase
MTENPAPKRKNVRRWDYDYSQEGGYFITICTHQQKLLFGQIHDGEMHRNNYGQVATSCWLAIPQHYPTTQLDEWIIMPNHMHGILFFSAENKSILGKIIGDYKGAVTRTINKLFPHAPVIWQRGYHEHIIRNETEYLNISAYIINNPLKWQEDKLYKP